LRTFIAQLRRKIEKDPNRPALIVTEPVGYRSTLDASLSSGIAMTDDKKTDIIAFLKTLSDNVFIKDKRFSEPK
jgi:hypothetical protein